MNLPSSSTSSSEPAGPGPAGALRTDVLWRLARTGAWTLLFLVVMDLGVNVLFGQKPGDHPDQVNRLTDFFEKGRSIEGKLRLRVQQDPRATRAVYRHGWLDGAGSMHKNEPTEPGPGADRLVAIYGMSFTNDVAKALPEVAPRLTPRSIDAPNAAPSHTYASYLADRGRHQAGVVVYGILSLNVGRMPSMTGATWNFEDPFPYAYPRYRVADGALQAVEPPVNDIEAFRATLADGERFAAYRAQLAEHDAYFDPLLFDATPLDRSVVVRLARRAYSRVSLRNAAPGVYDAASGFDPESEPARVLAAMVRSFADTARGDGKLPIVLLLNNLGYQDHLTVLLEPTLQQHEIPFVDSHRVAPSTDPLNYVADGHFTHAANLRITKAMVALIDEQATADQPGAREPR